MRIVAFSDTHTQHRKVDIPDGDVLLFAGDGEFRSPADLIDFNNWISSFKHKHIIAIAGNHDFFCERYPDEVKRYLTKLIYLRDEEYILPNGMKLWGSPMTQMFMDWAFMDTEENLERLYWSRVPDDTSILLVHGPAHRHLDIGRPRYGNLGSKTLASRIDQLKIPYVIHGHIHGSYGIEKTVNTTYINCSVLDEDYDFVNDPIIFDV